MGRVLRRRTALRGTTINLALNRLDSRQITADKFYIDRGVTSLLVKLSVFYITKQICPPIFSPRNNTLAVFTLMHTFVRSINSYAIQIVNKGKLMIVQAVFRVAVTVAVPPSLT